MGLIIYLFKLLFKFINFLRLLVLNLFFLFIIGVIFVTLSPTDETSEINLRSDLPSALLLNISGPIVEQRSYQDPFDALSNNARGYDLPKEFVLYDIVETIRHAAKDDSISGLVLHFPDMPETNLTKLRYIAKAISEFKASGKPIIAYGDMYNQSQYYLASYADETYMSPDGIVMLRGYNAYNLYLKDFFEKFKITPHVFRVGTYKSAVEPFIRSDMSEEAKASASVWLTQLWASFVDDVAKNRRIPIENLTLDLDEMLQQITDVEGDMALLTKNLGLVDDLKTRTEMSKYLVDKFGGSLKKGYQSVTFENYLASLIPENQKSSNKIAVFVANGTILDGDHPTGTVGGDTLSRQLRQARFDDQVKAVILRVDSPGGSAFASELIRQEVTALQQAGKPVIVSMSSVAASGGYWISMTADRIIAQPTTLTGSIGIFGVITTFENGLNYLGINTDGLGTSPFSGSGITSGLSAGASQAIQMNIEHGYQRFISLVSVYRGKTPAEIDTVAQGRVWTGKNALEHGLIDQLGDFDDAITSAAHLARLDDYQLQWIKQEPTSMELLMQELMGSAQTLIGSSIANSNPYGVEIPNSLQPAMKTMNDGLQLLNNLNDPKGYYSFCLPCQVQ